MTAVLDAPPLVGMQAPRILWVPPATGSLGARACEWARDALKVDLDPWQVLALEHILATREDGKWAAFECGLVMPRQNGKSLVLLVRELFGLFELGERLILHTAHRAKTSSAAYGYVRRLLEGSSLESAVAKMPQANGKEGVYLHSGGELQFLTRTDSGGRGLSGDVVVLDEAQSLSDGPVDALMPTLSARTVTGNPQLLYAGSAGTFESTVLARVRRRGISGQRAARLCFLEWSIDDEAFMAADPEARQGMVEDPAMWAQANPELGARISGEYILETELGGMDPFSFARERLGVGSWPVDDSTDWPIPKAAWRACADEESAPPVGGVVFAVDASWERTGSVAVCGRRADGLPYGELVAYGPRTDWVVAKVVRLVAEHRPAAVVVDDGGPVGSLVADLEAAGVELTKVSARENAQACGGLYDAVTAGTFRHRGQAEVTAGLAGAKKRPLADAWAFDRRHSSTDISPLVALTLARWGFVRFESDVYELEESVW